MTNPTPKPSGRRSHRRCGMEGEFPDRRRPTAAERAVERIKAWADGMAKEQCACCQCAGNDVLVIINEEAAHD